MEVHWLSRVRRRPWCVKAAEEEEREKEGGGGMVLADESIAISNAASSTRSNRSLAYFNG